MAAEFINNLSRDPYVLFKRVALIKSCDSLQLSSASLQCFKADKLLGNLLAAIGN